MRQLKGWMRVEDGLLFWLMTSPAAVKEHWILLHLAIWICSAVAYIWVHIIAKYSLHQILAESSISPGKKIVYPNRILHHIGSSAVISLEREIQGKRIIFKLFMLLEPTASPIKLGFCSAVTWSFWDITVAPAQTNKGHLLLLLCC